VGSETVRLNLLDPDVIELIADALPIRLSVTKIGVFVDDEVVIGVFTVLRPLVR
jgi:hypothetical protein